MIIVWIGAWNDFTIAVVPRRFVGSGLGRANWRIGFWFIHKPNTGPGEWRYPEAT